MNQAKQDKNFECLSEEDKAKIPEVLIAMEKSGKTLIEAVAVAGKKRKEFIQKNTIPIWKVQEHQRKQNQEALAQQYNDTMSCKNPEYRRGSETLMCNGKAIKYAMASPSTSKSNYLTITKNGLVSISPYLRQQVGGNGAIKVFNVHPNLLRTTNYPCKQCNGKGFLVTNEKNVTRYTPTTKVSNGLKITTTTTLTSHRDRYGGICGKCFGHGVLPAGWAYGK